MSALHELAAAIPADLPQSDLLALAAARGPLTDELPRTFSGAAARQWTLRPEPPLILELLEYHMFDVRLWRVRGADLAEVERTLVALPHVETAELERWLLADDPPTRMRGLRTAAVLAIVWTPALEQAYERALTDPRAGVRWAAFRAIALGRWPAAALLRRVIGRFFAFSGLAIDFGSLTARGQRRCRQDVIDANAEVFGKRQAAIVPVAKDSAFGMHFAQRVDEPKVEQRL